MNELDYYKAFMDWLGDTGKVTEADIVMFDEYPKHNKDRLEAEKAVKELFKGMF